MSNHYETLNVAKTATAEEIKKSYKSLASKHHPDKSGGNTQKFQEIAAAYEILSDENKRSQYDMQLEGRNQPQFHFNTNTTNNTNSDIFDMFNRQFGAGFADRFNQRYTPPKKNQDIRTLILFDLVDTLTEQNRTLSVSLPSGGKETFEIKIPRGIQDGETMKYTGLGSHTNLNIPRGDLYVQISVKRNIDFEQHGLDLYRVLVLNCFEAVVGCVKEIVGLDGRIFKLTIPPGAQHGAKFGISDAGLYMPGKDTRGRLIAVLNIYIPKNLTDKQLKIIKDLQETL